MAKTLVDNFDNGRYVGPTVKLTPSDVSDTPEGFEKRYDKALARERTPVRTTKLPPIQHRNLSDLMSRVGIEDV